MKKFHSDLLSTSILLSILAGGLFVCLIALPASGSTITLGDQNSTVTLAPSSSAGISSWTVNGTNELAQESYWYRIGSGTQTSLNALASPVTSVFLPGSGSLDRGADLMYSNSRRRSERGSGLHLDGCAARRRTIRSQPDDPTYEHDFGCRDDLFLPVFELRLGRLRPRKIRCNSPIQTPSRNSITPRRWR